ncbi:hypothetical protein WBP07_01670 [Novosphingobium sp. BL-8A]|uniref:hypothetical protein n=1 Tax=Novosphingobium sp. BL-8A TaxID=3127639 RepID=UPI0037579A02
MRTAAVYFVYANCVFWAGFSGLIDSGFWGILSFIGYFPASLVQLLVVRPLVDVLDGRGMHIAIFMADVIFGTMWWFMVDRVWRKRQDRRWSRS